MFFLASHLPHSPWWWKSAWGTEFERLEKGKGVWFVPGWTSLDLGVPDRVIGGEITEENLADILRCDVFNTLQTLA